MKDPVRDCLEERVRRLERAQHRIIIASCLLVVVLVACSSIAATKVPTTLEAKSIRIVSESGKNAAELGASNDGWVSLTFRDLNGELRFGAIMTPSGKTTLTWFANKKPRLSVGVIDGEKGEEISLMIKDGDGKLLWKPDVASPY